MILEEVDPSTANWISWTSNQYWLSYESDQSNQVGSKMYSKDQKIWDRIWFDVGDAPTTYSKWTSNAEAQGLYTGWNSGMNASVRGHILYKDYLRIKVYRDWEGNGKNTAKTDKLLEINFSASKYTDGNELKSASAPCHEQHPSGHADTQPHYHTENTGKIYRVWHKSGSGSNSAWDGGYIHYFQSTDGDWTTISNGWRTRMRFYWERSKV